MNSTPQPSLSDQVNPAHYRYGRVETIDVIEDAIRDAPDPISGFLQAQALRYLLRLWHKDNATLDASKSAWYVRRLVEHLVNRTARTSDV